ncbi:MAG: carboxypeptidase regulatory-like domain-containing protein [Flavobacteriales bacterium]|jgi:hypothetical protein|nr:carboxypeptidase regulatory-like domain-containing protein [Flavobacteriales bacterium]
MLNKITLSLFFILLGIGYSFAQSGTGTLKGTVLDESGEPLPFVNVTLKQNGNLKTGATTDFDGNFKISSLEPGKYDLEVSFVGYQTQKTEGIIIKGDKLLPLPDITLREGDLLDEVEVITYKVPLIDKDGGASGGTVSRDELARMPGRSAGAIASTVGGVQSDANGEVQSVRGARSDATYYYIDGIKVRGSSALPKSAIEEVSVLTGGLPANYGDVTGGIISITTRGASRQYFGGLEYITSGYKFGDNTYGLDNYGYNLVEGIISGPLLMKKDSTGEKTDPILGFFLSGNLTSIVDPRPLAIKQYIVKDDVRASLLENPVRPNPSGSGVIYNTDFLNENDFEEVKFRQNVMSTSANLSGKLDFNLGENMNFTVGGTGRYQKRNIPSYVNTLFNTNQNPLETTYTWRTYAKFTQRFANATEESESKGGIKNAFYTLMVDYSQERRTRENETHKGKIFNYGHVGTFDIERERSYTLTDLNGDGNPDALEQDGTNDVEVSFTASEANSDLAAITSQYFALNEGENPDDLYSSLDDIRGGNALRNGDLPNDVYSLWRNIGYQYNGYSTREQNQFRITGQGSADIGNHALTLGFEYEQRVDRNFSAAPVGLWTTMRQLANSHALEIDKSQSYTEQIGTFYRISYDQLNGDPGEYDGTGEQSFFDYNVRQKLGWDTDGTDYINVDALDPNFFSLDMFKADELISGQNSRNYVSYYGYDHTGKKLKNQVSFDDFFNAKDDHGNLTRTIGAFQPIYMAGYIMDKFSFDDLIFNVGVRVDRYDANQQVLKDPYLTYSAQTKGEVSELNGVSVDHPSNISNSATVYVDDVSDPTTIKGYRDGDIWYTASGIETQDLDQIKSSGNIQPLLVQGVDPTAPINSEVFEDYKPQINVMPRISFSFPISDQALFFSHYDVLTKRPTAGTDGPINRLDPTDYLFLGQNTNVLNNPNLRPEKTIDFELGFQQALNSSSSLKLSAFYKENRDMVTIVFVEGAYPNDYKTYGNRDFGTVKGLTAAYDLRKTGNLTLRAAYTLQFAESTGSEPQSALNLINARAPNLRTIYPVSFDQRHVVTGSLDYRYGEGKDYNGPIIKEKQVLKNTGVNFTGNYSSGRPYTAQVAPSNAAQISASDGTTKGNPFGARMPGTFTANMQIDRNITLKFGEDKKKSANMNVYLWVSNLFNTLNISDVYRATGNPDDDGFLNSANAQNTIQQQNDIESYKYYYALKANNPYNFGVPRQIRLGVKVDF